MLLGLMTDVHNTEPRKPEMPIKNPMIPFAAPLFRGFHSDNLATCRELHLIQFYLILIIALFDILVQYI